MARALWVLPLCLAAWSGLAAWADEPPQSEKPPLVEYGSSRSSSAWVAMPGGSLVGVDKGAAWKGVKVYISMTWDLVGVDVATGKTLFGSHVGAFWNAFTFKVVTPEDGKSVWAIELRPGARRRTDTDRRQYHDLRTGKKLEIPGMVKTPSGKPFDVRVGWRHDNSDIGQKFRLLVTTPKTWTLLQERMFSAVDPKRFGAIDWKNEVVFAISDGNSSNCSGFTFKEAYEDENRILLRIDRVGFQTMNGYEKTRPWGFFVLPRRAKAYEVEIDAQGLIGGPPIWRRVYEAERLPAPETELATLPPKSKAPHDGWATNGPSSGRPPPPPPKPRK